MHRLKFQSSRLRINILKFRNCSIDCIKFFSGSWKELIISQVIGRFLEVYTQLPSSAFVERHLSSGFDILRPKKSCLISQNLKAKFKIMKKEPGDRGGRRRMGRGRVISVGEWLQRIRRRSRVVSIVTSLTRKTTQGRVQGGDRSSKK